LRILTALPRKSAALHLLADKVFLHGATLRPLAAVCRIGGRLCLQDLSQQGGWRWSAAFTPLHRPNC
jgi:hypothetical protein